MITINLVKAKAISHDKRRIKRDLEFKPLDVRATIPAEATQAESARQAIRDWDDAKQLEIDEAVDVAALRLALQPVLDFLDTQGFV